MKHLIALLLVLLLLFAVTPAFAQGEEVEVVPESPPVVVVEETSIPPVIYGLVGSLATITATALFALWKGYGPQTIHIIDNLESSVESQLGFEIDPFKNAFITAAVAAAKAKYPLVRDDAVEYAVKFAMSGLRKAGPLIGDTVEIEEDEVRYLIEGALAKFEAELSGKAPVKASKPAA